MTTVGIFLKCAPRCSRALERIGALLVVAGLSGAAVVFYLYVCLSVTQLQQLSPDQLVRAFTGA
jgi:hypothetical protein